jgi:hypothetical protein
MKSRNGSTAVIKNNFAVYVRSNTDSITWRDVWTCTIKIGKIGRDVINISDSIEKALKDET